MNLTPRLLIVAALVVASLVSAGTASATSGTLVITSNTTLTEDHTGNIVIGADGVTLDCAGQPCRDRSASSAFC
jgi:hypothetical protein